jgi:hypothetical protein
MRVRLEFVRFATEPAREYPVADIDLAHAQRCGAQVLVVRLKLLLVGVLDPIDRLFVCLESRFPRHYFRSQDARSLSSDGGRPPQYLRHHATL